MTNESPDMMPTVLTRSLTALQEVTVDFANGDRLAIMGKHVADLTVTGAQSIGDPEFGETDQTVTGFSLRLTAGEATLAARQSTTPAEVTLTRLTGRQDITTLTVTLRSGNVQRYWVLWYPLSIKDQANLGQATDVTAEQATFQATAPVQYDVSAIVALASAPAYQQLMVAALVQDGVASQTTIAARLSRLLTALATAPTPIRGAQLPITVQPVAARRWAVTFPKLDGPHPTDLLKLTVQLPMTEFWPAMAWVFWEWDRLMTT